MSMTRLGIGKLGLPLIGIHEPSLLTDGYSTELLQTFHKILNESAIGKEILARLTHDPRVIALKGQMISSGSGASRLEDATGLAQWWLWRANNVGHDQTDRDLETFLSAEKISANAALWVYGVQPTESLDLNGGVRFLHINDMPDCSDKEDFLRENFRFGKGGSPAPSAVLIKSYRTNKIAPSMTIDGPEPDFEEHNRSVQEAHEELFTLAILLNCLCGICCMPGYGTSYLPPEVPLGPFGGGGGGTPIFDVLPRKMSHLKPGQEDLLRDAFDGFSKKKPQTKMSLQRSLFRLAQAKGRLNDGDRALDLGIALEMLLLNAEHNGQELPGQLNLHFRLRGSWLVGVDPIERRSLYKELGHIYSLRSQLAHNGFSEELDKLDYEKRKTLLEQHMSIAERIIQKLIIDGAPSDWAALTLGGA